MWKFTKWFLYRLNLYSGTISTNNNHSTVHPSVSSDIVIVKFTKLCIPVIVKKYVLSVKYHKVVKNIKTPWETLQEYNIQVHVIK